MKHMYKRIVAIGMASITALLAWIYCIIVYRDEALYIAILSLILIASVYALLSAIMQLHAAKEAYLQKYIAQTATNLLEQVTPSNDNEDLVRLGKASYLQMRKLSAAIAQIQEAGDKDFTQRLQNAQVQNDSLGLLTDSVIRTAKIIVKYSETNNEKLLEAIQKVNQDITAMRLGLSASAGESKEAAAERLEQLLTELNNLKQDVVANLGSIPARIDSVSVPSEEIEPETIEDLQGNPDVIPFPTKEEKNPEAETVSEPEPIAEPEPIPEPVVEEPVASEPIAPEPIPEPVAKKSTAPESAPEPVAKKSTAPESAPEPVVEKPAAPANEDPNRQLSPDEIAAMFASAGASTAAPEPEPAPEPKVEAPVNDDPNRQLSPDEIAAMFASAGASTAAPEPEPAPEPKVVAPENSDPNRQLTPDEIAALFSSANN